VGTILVQIPGRREVVVTVLAPGQNTKDGAARHLRVSAGRLGQSLRVVSRGLLQEWPRRRRVRGTPWRRGVAARRDESPRMSVRARASRADWRVRVVRDRDVQDLPRTGSVHAVPGELERGGGCARAGELHLRPRVHGLPTGGCAACAAGKHKTASGPAPCADCPADTYDEGGGAVSPAACLACQGNSNTASLAGRSEETACVCNAGFYRVAGRCTVCARNRHCPGGDQIFDFPAHSQGGRGLTLAVQCACDAGYYRNATRCLACALDNWCIADAMMP